MLLIIAHHHDVEAQWLYDTLRYENKFQVRLLIPEALGIDYSISLHLTGEGHRSTILFYDGAEMIEGSQVWFAINRLSFVSPLIWERAEANEKAYATNEINAFFPAFIRSLDCPVSNSIINGSLYGETNFAWKWITHFYRHGLDVHPLAADLPDRLFETVNNTPPDQILRLLCFNDLLLLPPGNKPPINFVNLRKSILEKSAGETLEFIFLKTGGAGAALLHTSKTPSLSCYGQVYITALYKLLKQLGHDITNGHTQRNALAARC